MNSDIINPFVINVSDEEILIDVGKEVFNNQWYLYFGTIQEVLLNNDINKVIIDLTRCEYLCPNFLISLNLIIDQLEKEKGIRFDVIVNDSDYSVYCVKESLLKADWCKVPNDKSDCSDYETIFPLQVFDIALFENINDLVGKIISSFKNLNNIFKSDNDKEIFIIKVKNILYELIDNTRQYAYPCSNVKFAGIYIRYAKNSKKIKEYWNKENSIHEKKFDLDVFLSSKIEIFYQDLGVGIINGYTKKYNIKIDSKRPLRETFKKLFFYQNNSLITRSDNTDICGLQYIGKILEAENNYLVVYNKNECVGSFLSNNEKNLHTAFNTIDYDDGNAYLLGLSYMFFIQIENTVQVQNRIENLTSAIDSLSNNANLTMSVIDQRNLFQIADYCGELNEKTINGRPLIDNNLEELFLFPGKITSKHSLLWKIKNALKCCKNTSKLIICDVLNYELELIYYSLSNTNNIFKDGLEEIHIVSETLIYNEYLLKDRKYVRTDNCSFLTFNKKYSYISSIKFYETYVLYLFQKNSEIGQYSITKGEITWDNTITLDGYINFDILITYPKMFKFLKTNLKRILPIIGKGKLIALDNMVSRLANEVNSEYFRDYSYNDYTVFLGSVYVSGTTFNRNRLENNSTIHFFNRSEKENIPSVFFTPKRLLSSENSHEKYIRIGKSYKIINEKDLNVHINNNCYLSTKETFEMLNNSLYNPIVCNHINFYGKHYILDLNVSNIFDDKSFKLSEFMTNLVVASLSHYINKPVEGLNNKFFCEFENACGIVYLSHFYTDKIISKTMELIPQYHRYIIGLNHINLFRYEQSLEFSSIYKQYIQDLIMRFKNSVSQEIKFIVFDTLINSGRTRKEIKLYLQSLGVDRVIFVSIIDAQEQRYNKSINDYCFMALNIPRLGRNSSCPICEANAIFNYFINEIIDPDLLARIKDVLRKWECKNYIYDYSTLKDNSKIRISNKDININNFQYESDEEIMFSRVFPLYLYISGKVRQVNDFLLFEEFLDNSVKKLEENSRALLLAMFLLEFHEECYVILREKVIRNLLLIMGNLKDLDISSLCLITLAQRKKQVRKILLKDNLITTIKLSHDLELLLIYVLDFIELKKNNIEFPKYLENKVKRGDLKKDVYKQFYCQLINTNGDSHDSPLLRLKSNKDDKAYATAASSLSLLKTSLESQVIQFDALYNGDNFDFKSIINQLDSLLTSIDKNNTLNNFELEQLNEIFNDCIKINSNLVYPIGISKKFGNDNIIQKIKKIVNEQNDKHQNAKIRFDNNYELPHSKTGAKELYYIFNGMLKNELEYALNNVFEHCFDKENNCLVKKLSVNERGTVAKYIGCLYIRIEEERITIDIVNNVNNNSKREEEINFKIRYQKEELKNLGVIFEKVDNNGLYEDFNANCFIQRIIIPNINDI